MAETNVSKTHEGGAAVVPRRIVVGTDGSATATLAVERAAALAKAIGAQLRVITATGDPPPGGGIGDSAAIDPSMLAGAEAVAQQIAERAASIAQELGVAEISSRSVAGDPAEALLDEAEAWHADLIVVGSRGMRSASRFLLGSVPNKVSHHAACDVLIVSTSR